MIETLPEATEHSGLAIAEPLSAAEIAAIQDERALQPVTAVIGDMNMAKGVHETLAEEGGELQKRIPEFTGHVETDLPALIKNPDIIGNDSAAEYLAAVATNTMRKIENNLSKQAVIDQVETLVRSAMPATTEGMLAQDREKRAAVAAKAVTQVDQMLSRQNEKFEERDNEIAAKVDKVEQARNALAKLIPRLEADINFVAGKKAAITQLREDIEGIEALVESDSAEIRRLTANDQTLTRDLIRTTEFARKQIISTEKDQIAEEQKRKEENKKNNINTIYNKGQEVIGLEEESKEPSARINENSEKMRDYIAEGLAAMLPDAHIDTLVRHFESSGEADSKEALEGYKAKLALLRQLHKSSGDTFQFGHDQILELVILAHDVFTQHSENAAALRKLETHSHIAETAQALLDTIGNITESEKESIGQQTAISANSFGLYAQLLASMDTIRASLKAEEAELADAKRSNEEACVAFSLGGMALREAIAQQYGRQAILEAVQGLVDRNENSQDANENNFEKVLTELKQIFQKAKVGDKGLAALIGDVADIDTVSGAVKDAAAIQRALASIAAIYQQDIADLTINRDVAVEDTRQQYATYVEKGREAIGAVSAALVAGEKPSGAANMLMGRLQPQLVRVAAESIGNQGHDFLGAIGEEQFATAAEAVQQRMYGAGQSLSKRIGIALQTAAVIIKGNGAMHHAVQEAIKADPLQSLVVMSVGSQAVGANKVRAIGK